MPGIRRSRARSASCRAAPSLWCRTPPRPTNSSNSQRLREVAERAGAARALLIPDAAALEWPVMDGVRVLGLSSGASAPESLVDGLLARLAERYRLEIDERRVTEEDVVFKLPGPLAD